MSTYLDNIIDMQHGSTVSSIVFLDVVNFSMRKSVIQQKVIREFSDIIARSMQDVSAKHVADSQRQSLNLLTDIIKIPTGDGAAIVFPCNGLQSIHLDFALSFLSHSTAARGDITCDIFAKKGWCNCHAFFDVRIGVSDGKAIVFKDANGNYNLAGNTVNVANLVMGIADRQQIIFTEESYNNLIDMTEDTKLEKKFTQHGKIRVKHDLEIDVCQYTGSGENFLNKETPAQILDLQKKDTIASASPFFSNKAMQSSDENMRSFEIMGMLKDMPVPPGLAEMMKGDALNNTDTARVVVEAFKAIDKLMKQGSGAPLIESVPEVA